MAGSGPCLLLLLLLFRRHLSAHCSPLSALHFLRSALCSLFPPPSLLFSPFCYLLSPLSSPISAIYLSKRSHYCHCRVSSSGSTTGFARSARYVGWIWPPRLRSASRRCHFFSHSVLDAHAHSSSSSDVHRHGHHVPPRSTFAAHAYSCRCTQAQLSLLPPRPLSLHSQRTCLRMPQMYADTAVRRGRRRCRHVLPHSALDEHAYSYIRCGCTH